mmetsp:Transcript_12339/g.20190  ORF Transcript_12339/g.20190 Transcript_12339/m.20190 type:complete len:81 (-) Transcript_12339:150-392(-)
MAMAAKMRLSTVATGAFAEMQAANLVYGGHRAAQLVAKSALLPTLHMRQVDCHRTKTNLVSGHATAIARFKPLYRVRRGR